MLAWKNGDLDHGVMTLGQSVGRVYDVPTTEELLDRMAKEAHQTLVSTNRFFA